MSSNPFRRSQQPTVSSPPPVTFPGGSPRIEGYQDAPPSPASRKKSVQIRSLPTSPQPTGPDYQEALIQRLRRGSHDGSPPPDPIEPDIDTVQQEDNIDPFDRELSDPEIVEEDEEVIENTRRNSAPIEPAPTAPKAPVNPFSKTLANMEPRAPHPAKEVQFDTKPTERTRASLDVDAFKRLLLTGSATPHTGAGTPGRSQPHLETLAENSSTAEAPSISRHPPSDPIQPPRTESPSTPYDISASEDERPYSTSDIKKPEKKKPPPPKHRHGKPVTSRTPQTVSFSDFSLAINTAADPVTFPDSPNTDLNKPLPPPPTTQDATPTRDSPHSSPPASIMSPPPVPAPSDPSSKKVPPAPPLARRHSQLRSTHQPQNRSRSNSNLTISSQHSDSGSTSLPTAAGKPAPPPPPPTRRSGAGGSQPEHTGQSLSRSSTLSMQPSPQSHSQAAPAPPPPRRGSSKSSFDGPRPSSEVLADARRSSSDSRRLSLVRDQEDAAATAGAEMGSGGMEGVDVLAEMERLQREVDALRGSYGRVRRES